MANAVKDDSPHSGPEVLLVFILCYDSNCTMYNFVLNQSHEVFISSFLLYLHDLHKVRFKFTLFVLTEYSNIPVFSLLPVERIRIHPYLGSVC